MTKRRLAWVLGASIAFAALTSCAKGSDPTSAPSQVPGTSELPVTSQVRVNSTYPMPSQVPATSKVESDQNPESQTDDRLVRNFLGAPDREPSQGEIDCMKSRLTAEETAALDALSKDERSSAVTDSMFASMMHSVASCSSTILSSDVFTEVFTGKSSGVTELERSCFNRDVSTQYSTNPKLIDEALDSLKNASFGTDAPAYEETSQAPQTPIYDSALLAAVERCIPPGTLQGDLIAQLRLRSTPAAEG